MKARKLTVKPRVHDFAKANVRDYAEPKNSQ